MIYNLSTYRTAVLPQVKAWIEAKGGVPESHLSELALATSCPIIVVAHFIAEAYGMTDSLMQRIVDLKTFYKANVEE